jgi:hypothetical protein
MKQVLVILTLLALTGTISACNKKEGSQPASAAKVEQKASTPDRPAYREPALSFLSGIQYGDKKLMYETSNLTPELVENSRNILTHTEKYKQTKKERAETEHALRMSGSIDFFLKKLTKILPKSAQLQLIKTTQKTKDKITTKEHKIKIIFPNRDDALVDKNGERIKEMAIRLLQVEHTVNGHTMQEFVFDNKDFEKMSDQEYEVLVHY